MKPFLLINSKLNSLIHYIFVSRKFLFQYLLTSNIFLFSYCYDIRRGKFGFLFGLYQYRGRNLEETTNVQKMQEDWKLTIHILHLRSLVKTFQSSDVPTLTQNKQRRKSPYFVNRNPYDRSVLKLPTIREEPIKDVRTLYRVTDVVFSTVQSQTTRSTNLT